MGGPKQHDWRFEDGKFVPAELCPGDDAEVALENAGFHRSQEVGEEHGLRYTVYEHSDLAAWIVLFQTAGLYCLIECRTWPDLIELLAKLSPIITAAVVGDGDLIACAHELTEPTRVSIRKRRGKL